MFCGICDVCRFSSVLFLMENCDCVICILGEKLLMMLFIMLNRLILLLLKLIFLNRLVLFRLIGKVSVFDSCWLGCFRLLWYINLLLVFLNVGFVEYLENRGWFSVLVWFVIFIRFLCRVIVLVWSFWIFEGGSVLDVVSNDSLDIWCMIMLILLIVRLVNVIWLLVCFVVFLKCFSVVCCLVSVDNCVVCMGFVDECGLFLFDEICVCRLVICFCICVKLWVVNLLNMDVLMVISVL